MVLSAVLLNCGAAACFLGGLPVIEGMPEEVFGVEAVLEYLKGSAPALGELLHRMVDLMKALYTQLS